MLIVCWAQEDGSCWWKRWVPGSSLGERRVPRETPGLKTTAAARWQISGSGQKILREELCRVGKALPVATALGKLRWLHPACTPG